MMFALVSLLIVAFGVSTMVVAAENSPERIAVTGTQMGTSVTSSDLNDGGIYHQDGTASGTVTLTTSTGDTYKLKSSSDVDLMVNTKTDDGVIHFDMKWVLLSGTVEIGTFEGQINGQTITYAYLPNGYPNYPAQTAVYLHTVLHGSGVFDGQTLKLDGVKLVNQPLKWEGLLLTR